MGEFTAIDFAVLGLSMMGVLGIAYYFKNRGTTTKGYVVADGKMGLSVFIATMVATAIGGGVLTGYVGTVYEGGLVLLPTLLGSMIIHFLIGMFLAAKAKNYGGLTSAQILGDSYGRVPQLIGGLVSMIYMFGGGMAMQVITLGNVLSLIAGVPFLWGAIISSLIIILYTWSSGLWGVAMTDYVQFMVLCIGIAVAGIMSLKSAGGWTAITAAVPQANLQLSTNVPAMIQLVLVASFPAFIDGTRYQRFFAARDAKTAKTGYLLCMIPWGLMYAIIVLMGFASFALFKGAVPKDQVFASLILSVLPPGARGLVFSALIAAVMSTADSAMLVGATNFAHDIYKPFINPNVSDEKMLKVTKQSVLVFGLLGVLVALVIPDILQVWTFASTPYVAATLVPMMAALFVKGKKSKAAALVSMLVGGGGGLILHLLNVSVFGQAGITVGVALSLISFVLITMLDKNAALDSQVIRS